MKTEFPLISAIIPVYNRPDQILDALKSILAQKYRPLEIIIGDDGSEDHTLDVIKSFLEDKHSGGDIPVHILELDHSGFPGAVRNRCAREASGEFLAFLDSDDLWLPEKLSHQFEALHKNKQCLISHTREEWNRRGKIISQAGMNHKREGFIFADALKKCIIGPSTVMISNELYQKTGGFRDDLEIAEDYEYWLRLTSSLDVGFLDEALTVKRAGHENQLSEKYGHIEIFRIRGLKDLVDQEFFTKPLLAKAARELSRKCMVYGRGCLKREKLDEGQEYLDMAGVYEVLADSKSEN
ncbi:glycosyltransferase family 2 protein [Oceanispirochaeta crateris]|uniref:Glycosyltransferase family 2 protein n=1 Tax=Oceanispirochaeta crateris TaxID=2518645 RepID=A0A5C1QQ52_9SPIO|nr:glycosyltransferase family A protein [Oceanispirochaeta crateris]QEN09329.1 glycosyltransferase family 2 protein [Oceanispirochaeta crateris]